METSDTIVVGAGVIGLAVAWRCAQRGLSVTLIDPAGGPDDAGTAGARAGSTGAGPHPAGAMPGAEAGSTGAGPHPAGAMPGARAGSTGAGRGDAGADVGANDAEPGLGAWHTAAGMLAPVTELHYEGRELLALNVESAARYPDFVAELADLTGIDPGYRRCGTVQAAWDAADLADLRALHAFQASLGIVSRLLTSRELRELSPALAAGLPGGLWAEGDHQVDPRRLHAALRAAAAAAGAAKRPGRVATIDVTGDRVGGVTLADGTRLAAGVTVLAAGAWSRHVGGLPEDVRPPVRPVKGQTLRLRGPADLLTHVVRGSVKGNAVYIVPRADGEIVMGASSEEAGFDTHPRTGPVYELLRDAATLVPALTETTFLEVNTGLRPGTPDNAPILGRTRLSGLVMATGHYRNGVLLTPVTADEIAALVAGGPATSGPPAPILAAFGPERFNRKEAAA